MAAHLIEIPAEFERIPAPRINRRIKVVDNGERNTRPIILTSAVDYSPTASQCAEVYQTALEGSGLGPEFDTLNFVDNEVEQYTANDLLADIARELSYYGAVYVHVRYNANFEKVGYKVLPYMNCRIAKPDSAGHTGGIYYHAGQWQGSVNEKSVIRYFGYNPNPRVIEAQVEASGGWSAYPGQVLFFRLDTRWIYGRAMVEKVLNYAITEYELSQYYKGLVLRRFEDVDIIRYRPFEDAADERRFVEDIKSISGLRATSSKLLLQDNWIDKDDVGNFRFDKLTSNATPDKFKHIEEVAANKIRKAFKNVPPILVEMIAGKLGYSSGEDLKTAWQIYNASVQKDQRKVERMLRGLFKGFVEPLPVPVIGQYQFLDDGQITEG